MSKSYLEWEKIANTDIGQLEVFEMNLKDEFGDNIDYKKVAERQYLVIQDLSKIVSLFQEAQRLGAKTFEKADEMSRNIISHQMLRGSDHDDGRVLYYNVSLEDLV